MAVQRNCRRAVCSFCNKNRCPIGVGWLAGWLVGAAALAAAGARRSWWLLDVDGGGVARLR